jgi:hypothetical protein
MELPAVPPARSPSDALRLDEHDVDAPLREMQRRRQPRIPAADDHDIGTSVALEPREGEGGIGHSGIERRGMAAGQSSRSEARRPCRV